MGNRDTFGRSPEWQAAYVALGSDGLATRLANGLGREDLLSFHDLALLQDALGETAFRTRLMDIRYFGPDAVRRVEAALLAYRRGEISEDRTEKQPLMAEGIVDRLRASLRGHAFSLEDEPLDGNVPDGLAVGDAKVLLRALYKG